MAALPPPPDNRIMQRKDRNKILNRKKNLFRKAYELSTLCDIDVAVFLFQPTNKSTTQPAAAAVETWPENPTEVQRIISKYKAKLPSTHASSPSTSPPAMKSTTSTPSSSSSSSPSLSPLPSPSRSVLEKRKYIDLDLSLSGCSDSRAKMLKDNKGKRKLLTQDDNDDDENINSQDAGMEKQFKSPITWDHAGGEELYHGEACDGHQAILASLEAKHKAITERIASLEATRTFFY